ncbi:hypothetical protein WMY93_014472 [Mugilogobius chulae]|uniref:Uncharacterized protein n=1 Tax=Mugilogobius chulae TaxID=88201 RepID=A0AAW0NZB0_9GOBI
MCAVSPRAVIQVQGNNQSNGARRCTLAPPLHLSYNGTGPISPQLSARMSRNGVSRLYESASLHNSVSHSANSIAVCGRKMKEGHFCQVVDLYWGVDPEEWDSPELQRLRMKLLEECLKTSAGPCFVLGCLYTAAVISFSPISLGALCYRSNFTVLTVPDPPKQALGTHTPEHRLGNSSCFGFSKIHPKRSKRHCYLRRSADMR